MLDALLDPWRSGINQRALVEIVLIGISGGVLGCWIVLFRLSYGAESMAHSLLPGLVLAALAGVPLLLGGAVGMLATALGVALISRLPGIERDTAVAVTVTPLLGLGALLALAPDTPANLTAPLFGDILGVTDGDLAAAAAMTVGLLAALALLHGRLTAVALDRDAARALGVRVSAVDAVLLSLIALALLVAVQGLGSLLVVAVLVGPAATARLLAGRLVAMMTTAAGVAVLAGAGGLYLSFYAGTAAGASVAGLLVAIHLLAALCVPTLRGRSRMLRAA